MEPDQGVRDLEQAEAWEEARVAAEVEAVVLLRARAVTVYAPAVAKEQPIRWEHPATT